jgi:hypothetical protein
MNDTKLVRDKSDKNFSFSYYASVPDLFIQIFLLFFCMFVSFYLVISDVRMMSLVIQLEVLKEILVIKLQTKKDLLLLYQVFTINIFH